MNNTDKIRQLLNEAKAVYAGYGTSGRYVKLLSYLDQALELLPCETCKGVGVVPPIGVDCSVCSVSGGCCRVECPCPTCQPYQPCQTCNGTGKKLTSGCFGMVHKEIPCPDCKEKK